MAMRIHPAFDAETRTWFVEGLAGEAPTIAELIKVLPKRKGGYHVENYWSSGMPPIQLPPPAPKRAKSSISPWLSRPPPVLKSRPLSKREKFDWTPQRTKEFNRLVPPGVTHT